MRAIVTAPGLRRHTHSLFETANVVTGARWERGVTFTPHGCSTIFAHDGTCWIPRGDKPLNECVAVSEFDPYLLEITLVWATGDLAADPKAAVMEAIEVGASAVLERLMEQPIVSPGNTAAISPIPPTNSVHSGGIVGRAGTPASTHHYLVDGALIDPANSNAAAWIAEVEAKLIDASDHVGGSGVIYMNPRMAVEGMTALDWINDSTSVVTRATGTPVVIGNFGNDMIYGHIGGVEVYLGDVEVTDATKVATNEYIVQAECYALPIWNPCAVFRAPPLPG